MKPALALLILGLAITAGLVSLAFIINADSMFEF